MAAYKVKYEKKNGNVTTTQVSIFSDIFSSVKNSCVPVFSHYEMIIS